MDLASLHVRIWRVHLAFDVELLELEQEEPRLMPHLEPMGVIEGIELPDDDPEDRLGFRFR